MWEAIAEVCSLRLIIECSLLSKAPNEITDLRVCIHCYFVSTINLGIPLFLPFYIPLSAMIIFYAEYFKNTDLAVYKCGLIGQ